MGRGVRRAFEGGREAPGGAWVWFSGMGEWDWLALLVGEEREGGRDRRRWRISAI